MIEWMRRNGAISALSGSRLPAEYQQVEFLESLFTGQYPYIELNISRADVMFDLYIQHLPDGYGYNDKSQQMGYDGSYGVCIYVGYKLPFRVSAIINGKGVAGPVELDETHMVSVNIRYSDNSITINNTRFSSEPFNEKGKFTIFRRKPYDIYMFGRIHIIKQDMHDNQGYIDRFFPCYRKYDNKPGMYDIVNNVFHTNAGTGEFTVGPDVIG